MNTLLSSLLGSVFFVSTLWAAPAPAPAGATAECKDGSYFTGTSKRGACSHHGGIQTWYGTDATTATETTQGTAPAAPAAIPAGPPMDQQNAAQPPSRNLQKTARAEAGGGQVWVNSDSKVYHCPGTHWYGTTKQGQYMSENDAIAQGYRADHNKACSTVKK